MTGLKGRAVAGHESGSNQRGVHIMESQSLKGSVVGAVMMALLSACWVDHVVPLSDSDGGAGSSGDASAPTPALAPREQAARDRCAQPGGFQLTPATLEEVKALAASTWIACEGNFTPAASLPAGIELAPDGSWHALEIDATGRLARKAGFGESGAYEILGFGVNGPGTSQINFTPVQNGQIPMANPYFLDTPRKMKLDAPYAKTATVYAQVAVDGGV